MSALLLGAGWKVLAGIGAALALFAAWAIAMMRAKAGGVAQQQAADTKRELDDRRTADAIATDTAREPDPKAALDREFGR